MMRLKKRSGDAAGRALDGRLDAARDRVGSAGGARRRAGGRRLSRRRRARATSSPASRGAASDDCMCSMPARRGRRGRGGQRRPRPVRDRARRHGAARTAARLREIVDDPFRRHAVSPRHRAPRRRARASKRWRRRWTSATDITQKLHWSAGRRSSSPGGARRRRLPARRRDRPQGGGGITRLIEDGALFERGGVNFSHVYGEICRRRRRQRGRSSPGAPSRPWACRWCCIRAIPYVPTVHMNVRCFVAEKAGAAPVWWFGGGMDLTPYYGFAEDAVHFHRTCRDALRAVRRRSSIRASRNGATTISTCKHRGEPRGIGGIFFDDLSAPDFATCFALTRSVGDHFLPAYVPIVERRRGTALRRARARVPGLPPRPLRRVQPGLRPRHAVRPAVRRPHRVDPDVAAAGRALALRLEAGAGHAGGAALHGFPGRQGLARWRIRAAPARPRHRRRHLVETPVSSESVFQGKLLHVRSDRGRLSTAPRRPARTSCIPARCWWCRCCRTAGSSSSASSAIRSTGCSSSFRPESSTRRDPPRDRRAS